jgi:NADH-quinone oxidoreductase subunit N
MPVTQVPDIDRIMPELLLTITGVLTMLIEPVMPAGMSRKPIGFLALAGVIGALLASVWQLGLAPGTAFFGTVQTDAFSVFFHVLICGVVLVTLLIGFDVFDGTKERPAEYYALVLFGATGMCLMTSAVELLLVFVSLEISSIATYILAAIRKRVGKSPEAGLKYFLLGSFATAFFLYGIALTFGATGTTSINDVAAALSNSPVPGFATLAVAMILIGLGFKVSAAPFQVWTPDVYEGAPQCEAHAGLLFHRPRRLHPGRLHRALQRRSRGRNVLHRDLCSDERGRVCSFQPRRRL